MRRFFSLAASILICTSPAQEAKITYTTVAVSAKNAIAGLAEKSGLKLACAPAMANEILILRLQDAPLDRAMQQIATVTSGAWQKDGDVTYLVPNRAVRGTEEKNAQQRLAAKIAKTLKGYQDAQAKAAKDPKTSEQAVPAAFAAIGAGQNAMTKLAVAIGADRLSSVEEGARVVFSSNPTGMQRMLPESANAAIDEFVVEYNKTAIAAKQEEPAKEDADPNMAAFMELFGSRMKKPVPITTAPAKALVVGSRRSMFGGFTLELKLYGANGKLLASSTLPLTVDLPFDPAQFTNPKPVPTSEGPEIELSPLTKELYSAGQTMGALNAGGLKLSKDLLAALRDPVEHDPLSFVHSEALIAISRQRNEQLVADLPDGVLSIFDSLTPKGKLTAQSFLKDIAGDNKADVHESDGWLEIGPNDPVKARKERTDRGSLRTLIGAAQSKGYASLDDVASYATYNEAPLTDAPGSTMYIMLFAPGAMQGGMMGMVDWDLVRLYGQLDSTQRQTLRQGGRLPFGQLAPGQQQQVSKMLFGANEVLMVESRQTGTTQKKSDPLTDLIIASIERSTGGNENDFRSEPTEVMPSGLPSNGFIQVNFTSEPVAVPQTMSSDFGRGAAIGPMELGMLKFMKDDPNMSQFSGQIPTMDDLKVGTRSVYNFSFYVAPDVSQKGQLNDDVIPKDAAVYKMANLPGDFQKRIDEMAATFKNNPIWKMIGQMGGMGQRTVPPQ